MGRRYGMKVKKTFDFGEQVKYIHSIEFEIDEDDVEAECAIDDIVDRIDVGEYDSTDEIVHDFRKAFGESVEYIEDGSPDVEFVVY